MSPTPECTCRIVSPRGMFGKEIQKCPLCKAAPELLAACKLYEEHFGDPLKVLRSAIVNAEKQS